MRRVAAAFLAFGISVPAWVAALAPPPVQCAMACHANGASSGAICCRVAGADGPVFKLCGESRDGVPLPPVCRMAAPRAVEPLSLPAPSGRAVVTLFAHPLMRSPEPAEHVPLALS
jgi:hypothetical protein